MVVDPLARDTESVGDLGGIEQSACTAGCGQQLSYPPRQSLGGLGLLLGTLGLAVVQLRSVLERRSEFALMRATGFRRTTLGRIVLVENILLLVGGLVIGLVAALVAVFPHLVGGGATIPWLSLIATLAIVVIVGLLAGSLAMRVAVRAPIVAALRGD